MKLVRSMIKAMNKFKQAVQSHNLEFKQRVKKNKKEKRMTNTEANFFRGNLLNNDLFCELLFSHFLLFYDRFLNIRYGDLWFIEKTRNKKKYLDEHVTYEDFQKTREYFLKLSEETKFSIIFDFVAFLGLGNLINVNIHSYKIGVDGYAQIKYNPSDLLNYEANLVKFYDSNKIAQNTLSRSFLPNFLINCRKMNTQNRKALESFQEMPRDQKIDKIESFNSVDSLLPF